VRDRETEAIDRLQQKRELGWAGLGKKEKN